MQYKELNLESSHVHKLLSACSGDAALLYLYIKSGNSPAEVERLLHMSPTRLSCATAILRQMGLWQEERKVPDFSGQRPNYTEKDVLSAMDGDMDFSALYSEIQRIMGRSLNTEELKILLGIVRYLGLPAEVVSVLVCYCKEKARQKNHRAPTLHAIEKEAYAWAEQGIDTMEEAAAYIQTQNMRKSQMGKLMDLLQIRGRRLTAAEERYANQWLEWGFPQEVITMAYERTCLNTGGLSWAYMHKILSRWQEAGLMTAEKIRSGDKKALPKGASGELADADYEAIRRMLQEG